MNESKSRRELKETVTVLRRLKDECEAVWKDVKAEETDLHTDNSNKRVALQTFRWYVSVCEMLEMYEDLLSEYKF